MNLLKSVLTAFLALFVDDGSFVFAVIAWVVAGVVCLRSNLVDPHLEAVLLFLGLAALLAENVARSARARGVARRDT